eukprot:CAMPEP_0113906850 /NCGR_PEP_ID=MMETSP0780_2-20120614/25057_1 /TAXON_ID=652834 /ORGANISM="Palpitomonas bilix" /LENGTH=310 /DNA_ID=CAMNT_0000901657 /DNA_START=10 /DNA_END=942 /DNA_ORIENTATION=- /assembly_acc=CAM_ASM_000599
MPTALSMSPSSMHRSPLIVPSAKEGQSALGAMPGVSLGVLEAAMGINATFPFLASYMFMYVRGMKGGAYTMPALKLAAKIYIPQTIGKCGQYFGSIALITGLNAAFPSMSFLNQPAGFAAVAVIAQQLLYKQVVDRTLTDVLKEKVTGGKGFFGENDFGRLWKQGKPAEAIASLRVKPAIPGFFPAFFREFGALGMSFHTGAYINNWAKEKYGASKLTAFASGCAAGAFGALITQPVQVLAMLQTGHVKQEGVTMSYSKLFSAHLKQFGVLGFWNGISMRIIINALVAGNNIMFLNDDLQRYFRIMKGEE